MNESDLTSSKGSLLRSRALRTRIQFYRSPL